ncbi:hypothetical protein [Streptomyces sp. NPDC057496]
MHSSALGAVEEACPDDARTDLLRTLTRDPDLGRAATRVLTKWGRTP